MYKQEQAERIIQDALKKLIDSCSCVSNDPVLTEIQDWMSAVTTEKKTLKVIFAFCKEKI